MTLDPRKCESLDEAAMNEDGTYNGVRALCWLSEVMHPGKGISEQDAQRIAEQAKERGRLSAGR